MVEIAAQTSPKNLHQPLYFFVRDPIAYLGLFSIINSNTKLSEFFKKNQNFPPKFTLFKNQEEINLDNSFHEAHILPFDELDLHPLNDENVCPANKIILREKIGFILNSGFIM